MFVYIYIYILWVSPGTRTPAPSLFYVGPGPRTPGPSLFYVNTYLESDTFIMGPMGPALVSILSPA